MALASSSGAREVRFRARPPEQIRASDLSPTEPREPARFTRPQNQASSNAVSADDEGHRSQRPRPRPRRDEAAELRALLHAHCQDIVVRLPRGGPGVHAAESLLFGIPEGVLRGVPDLIGGGLAIFRGAASHGLIDGVPTAKTACAALNLLRPFTPLLEQKSARIRVLHLAGAWSRIAEIRRATPRPTARPAAGPLVQPARKVDLRAELTRLDASLTALGAERADLHAKLTQLDTERSELHATLTALQAEHADLHAKLTTLQADRAGLHAKLKTLRAERAGLEAKLAAARSDLKSSVDTFYKLLTHAGSPSEIQALLNEYPDVLPTTIERLQLLLNRLAIAKRELDAVEAKLASRHGELGSAANVVARPDTPE